MDGIRVMAADGAVLPVSVEAVQACATLAHVTQHCTGGTVPVPFSGKVLARFLAALEGGEATVTDDRLPELAVVADYLACEPLLDSLCRRIAATITAEAASTSDLPLQVWGCVAQHVTLQTGCALASARPELAGILQPRLEELAKGVTLAKACMGGHLDVCRWLTETFRLTAEDARANDNYAFRRAAEIGHLAVCQWLAERFHLTAEDARDKDNYAFRRAAQFGHLELCLWLVKTFHLTAQDARANDNWAFGTAAGNGHLDVCQWLVETFHLTEEDARANDNRALRSAAAFGHLAVCQWLTKTFHLTAEDARAIDNGALQGAAASGRLAVCQWLVETFHLTEEDARANDNAAFYWAVQNGHLPVCQWIADTFGVTGRELYGVNYLNRYFCVIHNAEVCEWLSERFGVTLDSFGAD
jgi:hypothetical protein